MSAFEDETGIEPPARATPKPKMKFDFSGMGAPVAIEGNKTDYASRFFPGASKRSVGIPISKFAKANNQTFYKEEGVNKDGVAGVRVWRMS